MNRNLITIPAIIGTAMLTAMIVRTTPAQQDKPADPAVAKLNSKIDILIARVDRLEHASGSTSATESSGAFSHEKAPNLSDASGGRWMIIDNIQTSQYSPDYSSEIVELEKEAATLKRTIDSERRKMRDLQIIGARNSGIRNNNTNQRDQAMRAQRQLISRYSGELSRTNTKIKKLARAMNELTQIIHGHEGDLIVSLQSKHDLTNTLNSISHGDYVTWNGRRLDMGAGTESWEITSLRRLKASDSE